MINGYFSHRTFNFLRDLLELDSHLISLLLHFFSSLFVSNILLQVTCFVVPVAGFSYWVVGTTTVEGAEALVLGWFGYLVTSPCFERPVQGKSLIIAIVTAGIYLFSIHLFEVHLLP